MSTDEEKFFAWLDGELAGNEAAAMETAVAADPKLARLAEQHRALGNRLKGAFDPIATGPVPNHLRAALRPSKIIDFAAAKRARSMPSLPQWTAMAATLAIGILVGTLAPQGSDAPVQVQGGRLYAAARLNQALDTQLASAPANRAVRIGVTFRDQDGTICRSFTEPQASGLACRSGHGWQIRGLFAAPEGQGGAYRMAAGMDPNLAALIDSAIAGEALDAAQEKTAKQRGWR
jgi:hypothetical protein